MHRLAFAAVSWAFLATAGQPATTELTEEQKAEIADQVNALHTESIDAWSAGGYHRGMLHYLQTPEFTFALEGHLIHGFDALHDADDSWFANLASQTITRTESETTVLAPNVVCIMEQGIGAKADTAGVTGPDLTFARTAIYVRHSGEWKLHFAHVSVPTPEEP